MTQQDTVVWLSVCLGGLVLAGLLRAESNEPSMSKSVVTNREITANERGAHDGFDYEYWRNENASGEMVIGDRGTFSGNWRDHGRGNILFRKGRRFDETRTHQEIGNIKVEYGAEVERFGSSGRVYLCIYGWTVDPLVEYYIIESWEGRRPGGAHRGSVTIDGHEYDIYESTRRNQPSVKGRQTFQQYWSVRRSKRRSGIVSVSEHLKAFEEKGTPLGKMFEVAFTVEGWASSGRANVTNNVLAVGDTTIGGTGDR